MILEKILQIIESAGNELDLSNCNLLALLNNQENLVRFMFALYAKKPTLRKLSLASNQLNLLINPKTVGTFFIEQLLYILQSLELESLDLSNNGLLKPMPNFETPNIQMKLESVSYLINKLRSIKHLSIEENNPDQIIPSSSQNIVHYVNDLDEIKQQQKIKYLSSLSAEITTKNRELFNSINIPPTTELDSIAFDSLYDVSKSNNYIEIISALEKQFHPHGELLVKKLLHLYEQELTPLSELFIKNLKEFSFNVFFKERDKLSVFRDYQQVHRAVKLLQFLAGKLELEINHYLDSLNAHINFLPTSSEKLMREFNESQKIVPELSCKNTTASGPHPAETSNLPENAGDFLDPDMLAQVFIFTPKQYYPSLALVCKYWKNVFNRNYLWPDLSRNIENKSDCLEYLYYLNLSPLIPKFPLIDKSLSELKTLHLILNSKKNAQKKWMLNHLKISKEEYQNCRLGKLAVIEIAQRNFIIAVYFDLLKKEHLTSIFALSNIFACENIILALAENLFTIEAAIEFSITFNPLLSNDSPHAKYVLQALREKIMAPEEIAGAFYVKNIFTENGLDAMKSKLITIEHIKNNLDLNHLLDEPGFSLLKKGLVIPEKASLLKKLLDKITSPPKNSELCEALSILLQNNITLYELNKYSDYILSNKYAELLLNNHVSAKDYIRTVIRYHFFSLSTNDECRETIAQIIKEKLYPIDLLFALDHSTLETLLSGTAKKVFLEKLLTPDSVIVFYKFYQGIMNHIPYLPPPIEIVKQKRECAVNNLFSVLRDVPSALEDSELKKFHESDFTMYKFHESYIILQDNGFKLIKSKIVTFRNLDKLSKYDLSHLLENTDNFLSNAAKGQLDPHLKKLLTPSAAKFLEQLLQKNTLSQNPHSLLPPPKSTQEINNQNDYTTPTPTPTNNHNE